jgi:catechol 2,3-dioxygenase-like lactoylglutathione lyase family enzyme
MANISGPDFITILVSDLKASYSFYKEKIGLPESAEKRRNAHAFQTKPCGFAIRQASDDRNKKSRPGNHPLVAQRGRNCLTP